MLARGCVCDELDAPDVPEATVPVALHHSEPDDSSIGQVDGDPVCSLGAVGCQLGDLAIHFCELEPFKVCSSASLSMHVINTDFDPLKV